MANKKKKPRKFTKKLLNKYRLVVLNEDTFEERISLKLTRLNVFVLLSLSAIFLIVATTILIAFTPLREYIPGYSSVALKKRATELNYKTDSLQQVIAINEQYFSSIKKVLYGEVDKVDFNKDSIIEATRQEAKTFNLSPTKEDSILREKVKKEDKYNLFESAKLNSSFILFPPVSGNISQEYNVKEKHFAVDIIAEKGTPVKATADGTVIFADWTTEAGYVIILEHSQSLISVYKHNAMLTKAQGDIVTAGEVIATTGNTGSITTGPHLHFELWSDGYPINPTNFIDFK
ncbi:Murein DD-endopeptidase MepM and murein hydrolase activator NlpD, contain LysM domain [Bizionia echini]|jgi:murein DD-endopeptidase MepM/ murein hydrolase activator NlpD|uniref:Murein DD-endopeptidase MepM and murein hydrolase activator NlpD, contain LysM domain n=1 Tax=Bizionia echini TaxID=649333 RepID=A0A1I4Z9F3_9FLAO|nr:M23 family metallopeptidase [Bizionia echini]MBP94111.1 M23 family peptidase [Flavobacteriaceae bacterium]SFN46828.1 Murein DD-endopeptidase MepM and murein hydrolase activator NlpD, contain LysM domain [Bizionia echini]|tara:strand:+ start:55 stop:924 length:870 start_codon:yes stop_codon:yes gene_type:complete